MSTIQLENLEHALHKVKEMLVQRTSEELGSEKTEWWWWCIIILLSFCLSKKKNLVEHVDTTLLTKSAIIWSSHSDISEGSRLEFQQESTSLYLQLLSKFYDLHQTDCAKISCWDLRPHISNRDYYVHKGC